MESLPPELFIEGIFKYLTIAESLKMIECLPRLAAFREEILIRCCCENQRCMGRVCSFMYHCLYNYLDEAEEVSYLLKLKKGYGDSRCFPTVDRASLDIVSSLFPEDYVMISGLLEELVLRGHRLMFYWIVKRFKLKGSHVYERSTVDSFIWLAPGETLEDKERYMRLRRTVLKMIGEVLI